MEHFFHLIGSVALFYNKILLKKRDSLSWSLAIVGVIILCVPIVQKEMWIFLGYNIGFTVLVIYGWVLAVNPDDFLTKYWRRFLQNSMIALTFLFCFYLYIKTLSAELSTTQFVLSVVGLWSIYLLALDERETNIRGWILLIAGHILSACIWAQKGCDEITLFQLLSVLVCSDALKKELAPPV